MQLQSDTQAINPFNSNQLAANSIEMHTIENAFSQLVALIEHPFTVFSEHLKDNYNLLEEILSDSQPVGDFLGHIHIFSLHYIEEVSVLHLAKMTNISYLP